MGSCEGPGTGTISATPSRTIATALFVVPRSMPQMEHRIDVDAARRDRGACGRDAREECVDDFAVDARREVTAREGANIARDVCGDDQAR